MRKSFILLIFFIVCLTNRAQVVNGDLVGDNTLTMADVTSLINDLKNGTRHYLLELPEHDSFASDNSLVVGTWYSSTDSYTFNADGTTDYGEGYTYKFLPNRGSILLYDSKGGLVKALYVVDKSEDSMVLRTAGSSGLTEYSLHKQEGKHDYVDLGVSVYWAKNNVGATRPEDYGDHFAWGETEPKSVYNASNYTFSGSTIEPENDAAYVKWGKDWRMPTSNEVLELYNNCYFVWTNSYNNTGVAGFIVYKAKQDSDKGRIIRSTGIPSDIYSIDDTHIFIPQAGYGENPGNFYNAVTFWTTALDGSNRAGIFYSTGTNLIPLFYLQRYMGSTIRPVRSK